MEITGPLPLGATQIVDPGTGELIGYAYTVESEGGQTQRWLLYRHPQNNLEAVPPPPEMARWTLEEWQSQVPALWRPGSFYVRATARVYRYGQTYRGVAWTSIPAADALPKPQYPPVAGMDYQLDPTGWSCLIGSCSKSPVIAFTLGGLLDTANAEYWMLPASFGAKEGEDRLVVTPGGMPAGSLQEFVDTANAAWGPGCTFAIVGCVNYRGERAPAQP